MWDLVEWPRQAGRKPCVTGYLLATARPCHTRLGLTPALMAAPRASPWRCSLTRSWGPPWRGSSGRGPQASAGWGQGQAGTQGFWHQFLHSRRINKNSLIQAV